MSSARYNLLKKHIDKLDFVKRPAVNKQLERQQQLEQQSEKLRLQARDLCSHKPKGLPRSPINNSRRIKHSVVERPAGDDESNIVHESPKATAPSGDSRSEKNWSEPTLSFESASTRLQAIDVADLAKHEDTDTILHKYRKMRQKACHSLEQFFRRIRTRKELERALLLEQQRIDQETLQERMRFEGEEVFGKVNRILSMRYQIGQLTKRIEELMVESGSLNITIIDTSISTFVNNRIVDEPHVISVKSAATVEDLDPLLSHRGSEKEVISIQRLWRGHRMRRLIQRCEYPLDKELLYMNRHLKELVRSALQEGSEEPGCMPTPPCQPRSSSSFSDSTHGSRGSFPRGTGRLRIVETHNVDELFEIAPSFSMEGGLQQGSFFSNVDGRYEDALNESSEYQHKSYYDYDPHDYHHQQQYNYQQQQQQHQHHHHHQNDNNYQGQQNQLIVRTKMDIHSKPHPQKNYYIEKMKHFRLHKKTSPEKQREADLAAVLQAEWGFESPSLVVDHILRRRGKLRFGAKRFTKKSPKWKR